MIADRATAWIKSPERKSRVLQIALIAAVLLHLFWLGSFLLFPRLYGAMFARHASRTSPQYATIEMIMQNTKSSGGNHYLKDKDSDPGKPSAKPAKPQQATKPSPPIPADKDGLSVPSLLSPQTQAATAQTTPPSAPGNPGTGIVTGLSVVPASPDDKHPNVGPTYPPMAANLGDGGEVKLLIHIGANGIPTSVDILQSSGFVELDETARKTAMGWHMKPVIENGAAIPSTLPFAIDFDASPP